MTAEAEQDMSLGFSSSAAERLTGRFTVQPIPKGDPVRLDEKFGVGRILDINRDLQALPVKLC